MKRFLKKYWIVIVFVLAILAAFVLLTQKPSQPSLPSASPAPFRLLKTFPSPGEQELLLLGTALSFTFSEAIDVSSASVTFKPQIVTELTTDESGLTLFIRPVDEWKVDVNYELTLNVKSKKGRALESPVEFSFKFIKPTGPVIDESHVK